MRPTTICTPTPGILPVKLGYQHLEVGSDPEGMRVPPGAGEMERWLLSANKKSFMSIWRIITLTLALCSVGYISSSCNRLSETNIPTEKTVQTQITTTISRYTETATLLQTPDSITPQVVTTQPTSTALPNKTLEPTKDRIPTATAETSVVLPEWVSSQKSNVLLVATGSYKNGFSDLLLVNASDGESVSLPKFDIGGYFWTKDGKYIGLLLNDKKNVILIDTTNGEISRSSIGEKAIRFVSAYISTRFPNAFYASGSDINSPDFILMPEWSRANISFDGQYWLEKDYGKSTSVVHFETGQTLQLTDPDDNLYDYAVSWSPIEPYLAIVQSDEEPGISLGFSTIPHISLKVFDVSRDGELVSVYQDVTFPNWSPDGSKFLYQPLQKDSRLFWGSAACMFDRLTNATRCYNEAIVRHQSVNSRVSFTSLGWLPDQTAISYVYFKVAFDPYYESGGLCFIQVLDGSEKCILEEFEEPDQKIIRYQLSPDGKAVAFNYDNSCPNCDYSKNPKLAVADVNTGKYLTIGNMLDTFGLWQPRNMP